MNRKKITFYILGSALIIFIILNIIWLVNRNINYQSALEVTPTEENGIYTSRDKKYLYYVNPPTYLYYNGNLGVTDRSNNFLLIIWPSAFKEDKYGIRIEEKNQAYEIMVDKYGNPIDNNKTYKEILEKYNKETKNLMYYAKKHFSF